ncbi:MAG: hypothetical protein ACHQ52_12930, partial [Candidatus Eisenbacteria bacterium]
VVRAAMATATGDTRAALRTGGLAARLARRDAGSLVRVAAISWMGRVACGSADAARDVLTRLEVRPAAATPCPRACARTVRVFRVAVGHTTIREVRLVTIPAGPPCAETPPTPPAPASDTGDGS